MLIFIFVCYCEDNNTEITRGRPCKGYSKTINIQKLWLRTITGRKFHQRQQLVTGRISNTTREVKQVCSEFDFLHLTTKQLNFLNTDYGLLSSIKTIELTDKINDCQKWRVTQNELGLYFPPPPHPPPIFLFTNKKQRRLHSLKCTTIAGEKFTFN